MILTIVERLIMPSILPKKGKIIEMIVVESIKNDTAFTAKEIEEYQLRDTVNGVLFNAHVDSDCEIEFTEAQRKVVVDSIRKLDEQGEITSDMLSLVNKFCAI
jgi:hypothetical protein